jgi:type IX secretion system PorP/SprF family membrane protein
MKKIISILILLLPAFGFCQYVPQFSQLINTLEFVNPGYNASKDLASAVILYRNQWTGFVGAPKTYAFNANVPINQWHTGFGINSLLETRGLITQTNVDLTACVDVKITPMSFLTFGLSGGLEARLIDMGKAIWYGDQPFTAEDYNRNTFHTGIGLNLFTPKMNLGASLHYSSYKSNYFSGNDFYTFYLNGSYLITLNENWALKPSALFRNFGGYSDLDYGIFALYKDLVWVGISNRLDQALIFFADVKITNFLRIGYSYDYGISSGTAINYGSHEIRIELIAPRKSRTFERFAMR